MGASATPDDPHNGIPRALPTADGAEAEDDQRFGGRKGALECARNDRAAGASAGS